MLVFFIEFIAKFQIAKADCSDGYFDNNGTCSKCQTSWFTWDNSYECTSWSNRILNPATKLWEAWPDGTFFTEALSEWLDWKGSWTGQWASQNMWFDWSGNTADNLTYFSISQMKCVNAWSTNEVFIQDPQLRNFRLWRSLDYYVDPDSMEILELGTK